MPKTAGTNDNFLRSLMKEYEKSHQQQHFQLMQNKSGDGGPTSNTQILTSHGSSKHSQQQSAAQSAQQNKRGGIKVQKIQKNYVAGGNTVKANQIENIHKQISQNQKTMQNMTQNLFTKNNAGSLVPQGSAPAQSPQTMQADQAVGPDGKPINQQQIMVVKLK